MTSTTAREGIGPGGLALRFVFALVLVYATYNPTGYSYFHWVAGSFNDEIPASSWFASPALKFVVGVVLAIGWVIYSNAARRSLALAVYARGRPRATAYARLRLAARSACG